MINLLKMQRKVREGVQGGWNIVYRGVHRDEGGYVVLSAVKEELKRK